MKELIESLQKIMLDKNLSAEQAAHYIGCSGIQVRRWIKGTSKPRPIYREAIKVGILRITREAI